MGSEEVKGVAEMAFFSQFISISGLPYHLSTAEKRPTPEPDILCIHDADGPVAFELVELCDSKIAKSIVKLDPEYIRTSDPSVEIIRKKLTRQYNTAYPIELLAYTNGAIITPVDVIIPSIKEALNSDHPFRRVWLLSKKAVRNVWP